LDWSFQLYSARDAGPWPGVLKQLSEAGYARVEGFGGVYDDAAAFRAELERNGLTMPSGHFGLDQLESDFDGVDQIARTLGVKLIVCPWLDADQRPDAPKGWRALGNRLDAIAKRAAAAGYDFAWHNHDFEVTALPDGSTPMDHLLESAPAIGWEIDVAWIVRGGSNPAGWIERYADRITAVHVKDIAPAGENADEDGWADLGYGTVDWRMLYRLLRAKTPATIFVVEHDKPNSASRFARRSIETAQAF